MRGIGIYNCLQVAQLMRQAQLALFGGSFQLSQVAVAHPHFCLRLTHHLSDHIRTAIEAEHMQDSWGCTESPFPPVAAFHPAAGLITVDHPAFSNNRFNLGRLSSGSLAAALHNVVDPTLADLHPVQVPQRFLGARVAQMLFLPVVHHTRFQPSSKAALHFQPSRRLLNLLLLAAWAHHFVLAHFDHLGLGLRQFRDLIDFHQPFRFPFQFCLAVLTALRPQLDHLVRFRHKLALIFLVPFRRSVPVLALVFRLIALLVFARRLRRILGIGRRLLVLFEFHFQRFVIRFQLGKLFRLLQNQLDQFIFTQRFKIFVAHWAPSYQLSPWLSSPSE